MSLEPERRAFEVFDAVCDLAPGERAAALLEHCGEDTELRALVDRMLEQDGLDRGSGVLDESDEPGAGAQVLAAGLSGAPPERVGRYRIIREIGRGGMGVVYEAEQETPRDASP